eukprot:5913914-Lingulodinium_polyedra.AAC.1
MANEVGHAGLGLKAPASERCAQHPSGMGPTHCRPRRCPNRTGATSRSRGRRGRSGMSARLGGNGNIAEPRRPACPCLPSRAW